MKRVPLIRLDQIAANLSLNVCAKNFPAQDEHQNEDDGDGAKARLVKVFSMAQIAGDGFCGDTKND
jgi:hypothetical protein